MEKDRFKQTQHNLVIGLTARSGIFANIAFDLAQKTLLSIVHDSCAGIVKLLVMRMVDMCP